MKTKAAMFHLNKKETAWIILQKTQTDKNIHCSTLKYDEHHHMDCTVLRRASITQTAETETASLDK